MAISRTYHGAIDAVVAAFGATHSTMHVHVGLAIYLVVQLAVRTRRGSMTALHVVFLAEVAKEVMDRLYRGAWNWPDTASDFTLTMMWPVAITLVSQYRRVRWERMHRRADAYHAAARELLAEVVEGRPVQDRGRAVQQKVRM